MSQQNQKNNYPTTRLSPKGRLKKMSGANGAASGRTDYSVRVAYAADEVKNWTERIIVVDLFRFSNTVCALMASGRKNIKIYSNLKCALIAKEIAKDVDLFSEIDFPALDRYDNSPYLAMNFTDASKDAIIITCSGSKAVLASVSAREVIIGCFANLPCICEYAEKNKMNTLIVPACIFYDRSHVEDFICSRALQDALNGKDTFPAALEEIHKSSRVLDFLVSRPEDGKKDIEMTLKKGTVKILPKATIKGIFAEVSNISEE